MEEQSRKRTASQRTYMKKERLPTQSKTKQCSFCKLASVKTFHVGKSLRRLCPTHLEQYKNKDETFTPSFRKASDL